VNTVSPLRQRFPLGGVLLAAIVGILLASSLGSTWALVIGLIGGSLLLLPFHRQGGVVLAATAAAFALLQLWCWNDAPALQLALWFDAHPQEVAVQGIVVAEPKIAPSGMATFSLLLEKITTLDGAQQSITLPVQTQVRWAAANPASTPVYGDRVSFQAVGDRLSPPRNPGEFDYREWLERHGIYTRFSIDPSQPGKVLAHGQGNPFMAWALSARHRMETILSTDLNDAPLELSAIKGITLGVTENAPEGFTDDFRFTGTMHLFAVSGLHVGMLAVMIWFVLMACRLPRPWAVAIIIPMLFFYVAITGLKSGSIRSASMVSLLLCGSVLYRRSPLFNTLAAAALLQLSLDPNALFSAGWQFSYSVVFAILAITPRLEERLCSLHCPDPFIPPKLLTRWERTDFAVWKYFAGLLAISTAAWIGSLIPTIAYFHLISLSAIGANLLAVPLAFAVLALGALALLAGGCSLWVAGAFNNANWLVTKLLLIVVQTSALLPGGHWFVGPPAKPYPVVTVLDLGGSSCAVVQNEGECALLNAGSKRDAQWETLLFLESQGVNSIQSILVTKSDAAHVGGVPEIAHTVKVTTIGLCCDNTRSSVAKAVLNSLSKSTVKLSVGMRWPLLHHVDAELLNCSKEGAAVRLNCSRTGIVLLPRLTPELTQQLLVIPKESLHAEVLIMPLGGSEVISTLAVIRKVSPRVLVSPVDRGIRNGVPSNEWKELMMKEDIQLLRQDETGAVVIEADPKRINGINGMTIQQFVPENDHAASGRSDAQ
jgi:ComEC/Rec2-related protein